ncbi:MAG TPA: phosphomannomutase/phosphoglucomutase [Pseudomonadales bacterium]|jgi:phosphomannomutase/phosphoglucomutase|nr:phosphomannomutase/phosphoglucomutase [Pseudomonadales bacterium]HMW84086.1 phosphomannomutase/phosphoglucomutase [Pseudomonadales bacterium]HMZ92479.1 phosphomannomutase/phosphoglucomutase [Pseudomonadales bacterium]HNB84701.1 phosphomannomutase/phosphoglucomutase [Pseudomonadales bacterium]HNC77459.1 phosphomannomutase/phosphoglucomutase [Pseudomonadales bacterium]
MKLRRSATAPAQPSGEAAAGQTATRITPGGGGWRWGLLLWQLLAVVGATLLLDHWLIEPIARQQGRLVSEQVAGRYQQAINQTLHGLQQSAQQLAQQPQLISALQANDAAMLEQLSGQGCQLLPLCERVIVVPLGQALEQNQHQPQAAIGFALLEMIHRSEAGEAVAPQLHPQPQRPQLHLVEAVVDPATRQRLGTVVVSQDPRLLNQALSRIDADLGKVVLRQRIPGVTEQKLLEQGNDAGGERLTLPTSNPLWQLDFSGTPASVASAALRWLLHEVMAGVALLLLLGTLLIDWLRGRQLVGDATTFERLLMERFASHAAATPRFSLPLFTTLATVMSRLFAEQQRTQPASAEPPRQSVTSEPATAVAVPADETLLSSAALQVGLLDNGDKTAAVRARPAASRHPATPPARPATTPLLAAPAAEIFRAYDIRGKVGENLSADDVRLIGQAIGSEAYMRGEEKVIVGRDGRLSSPELSAALIQGLLAAGREVLDIGEVTTPMLYFATHLLDSGTGVMVTGSHNPPHYNGLKVVMERQALHGADITALHQRIIEGDLMSGAGSVSQLDISDSYFERIVEDIALLSDPLPVAVDCGNGIAGRYAPRLLAALGCEVTPLFCEVDGRFPNHLPDPSQPRNLQALIETVQRERIPLGLAFDGDGDRLIAVTGSGKVVPADQLLMLFAREVLVRNPGADVLFDIKSSRHLNRVISEAGGRPVMWKSGHSLMKAKMRETGAVLGGELSGHLFFHDRWYGFDDGLYAAARLIELLSGELEDLDHLLSLLPASVTTPELLIEVGESEKFALIDRLISEGQFEDGIVTTLDGIRVDYPDGWGLVRASNTTPALTLRFEAQDNSSLQRIMALFRAQLQQLAPRLDPGF